MKGKGARGFIEAGKQGNEPRGILGRVETGLILESGRSGLSSVRLALLGRIPKRVKGF